MFKIQFRQLAPVSALRGLFLSLFFIVYGSLAAQHIDLVINKSIYTSYFSKELKVPLYIEYDLYQGGGNNSRKYMRFKEEPGTARAKDYHKSGFDKGHLVSAEDFAFDENKERLTFSFYNCFPQYPRLNRGSWKSWEATIRKESQKWPLKIYVGGIYGSRKINGAVGVPDYCWKVVFNKNTGLILHALLFKNTPEESVQRITLKELQAMAGYPINFGSIK